MYTRRSYHPEGDRLATVGILFLEKYSGTYRTRSGLRTQIEHYLDNEYKHSLKWMNREKDLELLTEFVARAGGVVIVELPLLNQSATGRGEKADRKTANVEGDVKEEAEEQFEVQVGNNVKKHTEGQIDGHDQNQVEEHGREEGK